ncbi:MAG: exopolyphosphatase [Methylococcaceae bacterium]|nr:exopolyphosphatase [Methylococcaceae bacterium]
MSNSLPEMVAAVDLGSNSFHMIVCNLKDEKLQTVDRLKEMVRLASGLDKKNNLDEATQAKALACLERFGQRIRNFAPGSVRIVGTNTLRTAKNARQFIVKAEQALGHPIHIISGIEEARLIYQGVAHSISSNANLRFVMDIGGGSTEYIIGSGDVAKDKESLNMGCVSISNGFFKQGKISLGQFKNAVLFAEQELEPIQKRFNAKQWDEAIGASGSLRAIDEVLKASHWSNNGITQDGLEKLVAHVIKCKHIDELNLPELNAERLPVFLGGLAIIYATFKVLGINQMTVADGALREGLIYDLLGRIYHSDIRSETVQMLAERFQADGQHAARIKHSIQHMLRQLHVFREDDKETVTQFMDWAATLHEIGRDIAHHHYHKHSAYIIANADLAGFSSQDQAIIATIVRSHRRKFAWKHFEKLPAPWDSYTPMLCIILRIAVVLHRNRYDFELPNFKIVIDKSLIELKFPTAWLEQAPLTHADLKLEADYLKAGDFKLKCL